MLIEINSEQDAWATLHGLINGNLEIDSIDDLRFGDWVGTRVYIPEGKYDSALSAYMMQGWQDAQRAIYRSYALLKKGDANARSLTDEERSRLELVVKVSSGSSDQKADILDVLKETALSAVGKMEPKQIATVLIVLILTWGGTSVTSNWLNNQKEIKLTELRETSSQRAFETIDRALQTIGPNSMTDDQRQVLRQATEEVPALVDLQNEAENARHSITRHATKTDAQVNGVSVPSEAGQRITRETRQSANEVRKDGNYRILKVDTTVPDGFRVLVENIETGERFSADVQQVLESHEDRAVIQAAEWSKVPVRLQVNARQKRGQIIEAIILKAEKFEVSSSQPSN
ncbi:hypothetical protein MHM39_12695 [Phaeobacter sp. CNT1-3]|nr:hypothetical protein [Phaeobacter sp. CNT1-3]